MYITKMGGRGGWGREHEDGFKFRRVTHEVKYSRKAAYRKHVENPYRNHVGADQLFVYCTLQALAMILRGFYARSSQLIMLAAQEWTKMLEKQCGKMANFLPVLMADFNIILMLKNM